MNLSANFAFLLRDCYSTGSRPIIIIRAHEHTRKDSHATLF